MPEKEKAVVKKAKSAIKKPSVEIKNQTKTAKLVAKKERDIPKPQPTKNNSKRELFFESHQLI